MLILGELEREMASIKDYKIVIPADADFYEDFAKDELIYLLSKIGISLPVFKDSILFEKEDKIISIGRTLLFAESGISAEYDELKRDGHKIVTQGNTLFLVGGGSYGTVYAVYGFLTRQFGYTYFNPNEIVFKRPNDFDVCDYSVTDIPDFENRTGGFYFSKYEPTNATRYRTFRWYGFMQNDGEFFGSWDHNHIRKYMPTRKYLSAHPDWYSPEFTQLCLSNEEMWVEFTKNVIEEIKQKPDSEYFLLGQEDRPTFCGCKRCRELEESIGKSGIMMRFTNYVAREVEKWRKKNAPERHIWIGTFAYQKTTKPPVKEDENGNYIPLDPSVVPEDNVFIMLAPISADMSVTITDEERNLSTKKTIDGWFSLTENCIFWTYCSNFDRRFFYFDHFHVTSQNYKILKDYKFKWLYYSNQAAKQGMAFQALACYLHSNLAWNVELDIHELAKDFMENYYKEGASEMKEYLKKTDEYYKKRKQEFMDRDGRYYGTYLWLSQETTNVWAPDFYTWEFITEMNDLLDKAVQKIKQAGYGDREQEMIDRIEVERFSLKNITAEFFKDKFTKEEYFAFLDKFKADCERMEITSVKSKMTLDVAFDDWKKKY